MNIDEMLEISDCPLCEGGALLEEGMAVVIM